jgi:acyl carrier protein
VTKASVHAPGDGSVGEEVRRLLAARLPVRWRARELSDRVALGGDGLGLDSIRLLEVVLACEERFGVSIPVERLRVAAPTIGDLVDLIERAMARVGDA